MAKSDAAFLQKLKEEALKDQEAFLSNIATRLGRAKPLEAAPVHNMKGAPEFWEEVDLPLEQRIKLFMTNWQKAGGHTKRLASMAEAQDFIANFIAETRAKHLIIQDQPELESLRAALAETETDITVWNSDGASRAAKDELVAKAAGADIGIVAVEHAVAYTGSLVITSDATRGRSVSLLPTTFIAIIPADRLKSKMGEVLRPFDELAAKVRPAGIHFISGPSRSADIENDLTIGVHGPGIVYALIIE
ncbi:L-lactate dehydrogenase complex protein LldG [Paenibacillus sp. yr247]|uniref:LutC/YkgG family protein n=1 Tax=Paenibacillus sp. yr247 TaxID=1761880 RepID=UPI00088FE02D|nr:LUD domain-containing protein [Paenibacillus sp. yr247]SDN19771.1 L-lactate dehydrogenase complex protein LldG [Paenibacillus sp. yr247]